MVDPQIRQLARRLSVLEKARLQSKQPNLGFSTIDAGAIQAVDEDENLTMIVGQQFDNTYTAAVVTGPTPPTPIVPYVTSQAGALRIYWDGTFANGDVAPMDFARVLAYAEPSSTYTGPEPLNQALIVGQFTSATGAELTAALDPGVEYVVYLVTWTQAGKYGTASAADTATVGLVADAADLATKSTVYRQTTQPWANGAGGHSDDVGDLWFDTTLGPGHTFNVLLKSLTSNVATLTTDGDHGLQVGNSVAVSIEDTTFDGVYTITAVTSTTLSYAKVHANVTEVATTGTLQGQSVSPLNKPYIWDGANWVSVQDSDIDAVNTLINGVAVQVNTTTGDLIQTQADLETLRTTAIDAQNTAYAADGRISISDYEPGPDDVPGKQDGSMWITRTRDRLNLCVNPSAEVNTTGWTPSAATLARVADSPAGDGAYVFEVTNNSASGSLHFAYLTAQVGFEEGQDVAMSAYLKSISGAATGYQIFANWYNASAVFVGQTFGTATTITTTEYSRISMLTKAPAGAVAAYFGIICPGANINAVWRYDAVLLENSPKLGRYFDGGSEGGAWTGTPENSTSTLDGNAIIRLFTLEDESWTEKFWTADTISSVNASTIDRGEMNGGFIADGTIAVDKMFMVDAPCSENITAGDMVNVWNNNGVHMVRQAKASAVGYEAHGFVLDTVTTGQQVKIYTSGYNPLLSNLAPGVQFLATTAGKVSSAPPTDVGTIVQRVGHAPDSTTLNFAALSSVAIT